MGFKMVRDLNEKWCREHGVPGQWRICKTPVASLAKKLNEELGELAEELIKGDAAAAAGELYDLLDAVGELILLLDPAGAAASAHKAKVGEFGQFSRHIEWSPVPPGGEGG
jgi:NTP pyrophosphatase (non-canonical NTP hydrolase)